MKNNKYLKELGIQWYDLPGNYIPITSIRARLMRRWYLIKRGFCFMFQSLEDRAPAYDNFLSSQAFDKRNKENKEGFCEWEFYSLDYSMALYIYPRLREFREKYAKYGTPSSFCFDENGKQYEDDRGHENWLATIDKMIRAFELIIKDDDIGDMDILKEHDKQIEEGLNLYAKNYRALWW